MPTSTVSELKLPLSQPGPSVTLTMAVPPSPSNTVLFNPKRGDIKVAQCRVLLDTCKALMAEHEGDRDLAVCGDFNSAPNSGVYEFVRTGALDCLRVSTRGGIGRRTRSPGLLT